MSVRNIFIKLNIFFVFFIACSLVKADISPRSYNSVVLVLEETLVRLLSSDESATNYFPDHVIGVNSVSEKIALRPYASRFLREMSAYGIKVYVVSQLSETAVNDILSKFYMLERGVPLNRLVSVLPFSTLTTKADQLRGTLDIDKTLFAIPSIYEVNSKLNRLSIANTNLKPSILSKALFLDQSKLGRTFFFLAANMGWHPQLNGEIAKKSLNANEDIQTAMGLELFAGKFSLEGYDLDIPTFSNTYECTVFNRLDKTVERETTDLDKCYDYSKLDFRIAREDQKYACQIWTREKKPVHLDSLRDLGPCFISNGNGFFAKTNLNNNEVCGAYLRVSGRYQPIVNYNSQQMSFCDEPLRGVTDLHGNGYVYYPENYPANTPESVILETLIKKLFSGNLKFSLQSNQNLSEFKCSYYRNDYSYSPIHTSSEIEPCLIESNQVYFLSPPHSYECTAYLKKSDLKYIPIEKVANEKCKSDQNILIDSDKQISIVTKIPSEFKQLSADEIFNKVVQTHALFVSKLKYDKDSNNHRCEYFLRDDSTVTPYTFENIDGCLTRENNIRFLYQNAQNPLCKAFLRVKGNEYQAVKEVSSDRCQKENALAVFDSKKNAFFSLNNFNNIKNLGEDELLERARKAGFLTPSSYRELLKGKAPGLIETLGNKCTAVINEITESGGTLDSNTLRKALHPLNKIKFGSGVQDNTFYHYTNQTSLIDLFKLRDKSVDHSAYAIENHLYDNIHIYLRSKNSNFWNSVFYVAEDPKSSESFGNYQVEFILDTETSNTISYDLNLWKAAVKEIEDRYPKIKQNCRTDFNREMSNSGLFGTVIFSDIFYIVAEDSGVQAISYDRRRKWFQIITPEIFKRIK